MNEQQFIKKHRLTEKSVPKLYNYYLTLLAKGHISEAMNLTLVINTLDINKTINY